MELSKYVACICEGGAERAIMDILLENNLLKFRREDMIEEEFIPERNAKKFEARYLRKSFDDKISIIRILDSHNEIFNLSKEYEHKVDVINIVTAPEIEMLTIVAEGKYSDYKKHSGMKPSQYCKEKLGLSDLKKPDKVKEYFKDVDVLVNAIKEYSRVTKRKRNEYLLIDILNISDK